ncbi:YjjW family glycine radical enzyme activase [Moellerella wisconsensis]|uniref:YjjW family glycine radical enzyme activase n=1 Tax=Moellerella wisconsensis TaxID=158849 RepID=A0ACD3Y9H9_9GAMM|nr:YjjW family glycine radical enzyme activase [Moellerella wisconsensis]UNH39676.1 YjjW family glycine radical enzyme activase [Moellerella wisconsensis]
MNKRCATINKILPFSCVDGPGNRLVIFLQGCNLNCLNCHNPYTMTFCDNCGDCVATCPHGALSFQNNRVHWESDICQQCDTCLQTCTKNSTPMTGQYSVDSILAIIRQYLVFINGITVSGGEATLQLPFIMALFSAIKNADDLKHLSCFIDSNGHLSLMGWKKIIPYTEGTMIDLKAWKSENALYLTGRDNQKVIDSIKFLARADKLYEVRLLYIPDQTDYLEYIDELSAFLLTLPTETRIKINAFQTHGVTGTASTWASATKDEIEYFASLLAQRGIQNLILPQIYL